MTKFKSASEEIEIALTHAEKVLRTSLKEYKEGTRLKNEATRQKARKMMELGQALIRHALQAALKVIDEAGP